MTRTAKTGLDLGNWRSIGCPANWCKEFSAPQAGAKQVGHLPSRGYGKAGPRLPHSLGRCGNRNSMLLLKS